MAAVFTSTAQQAFLFAAGACFVNQSAVVAAFQNLPQDTQDTIIAHSGGTQAAAFPLIYGYNRVITVAAGTDSVIMPPAVAGREVVVINDAASNSMTIFGAILNPLTGVGDTIDAVANATGNACAAAKRVQFNCITTGAWISNTGAKVT